MDLFQCTAAQWSPAIGDPSIWGWIVVAAYAAAAVSAGAAAARPGPRGRERWFWVGIALAMAALGVNKQLDLQSALTAWARCLAQAQGWYETRGRVQVVFIEAVAAGAVFLCLAILVAMRRHLRALWPAILGMSVVLAYVAIRAAGFHHVDRFISTPMVAGIKANPLLELTGIVLVLGNALVVTIRHRSRPDRETASPSNP